MAILLLNTWQFYFNIHGKFYFDRSWQFILFFAMANLLYGPWQFAMFFHRPWQIAIHFSEIVLPCHFTMANILH